MQNDVAYLALHYQNENCHPDGRVPYGMSAEMQAWRTEVLAAAGRLLAGMRGAGVPVIHVRLETLPGPVDVVANCRLFKTFVERDAWPAGSWGTRYLDGFEPAAAEPDVTHGRNNAFYASRLDEYLFRIRPRTLVISGVSTAYVVESTVRHAVDAGYDVVVAHDACSTFERERHDAALRAMSLLATIASTDDITAAAASGGLDRLIAAHWARH
jgi:biuret amidohydrolase